MGMRTDAGRGDHSRDTADRQRRSAWMLGSRIATRNVRAARYAYLRYAEAAETTLAELDSATSRVGKDLWTLAVGARDALGPRRPRGETPPPESLGRSGDAIRATLARTRSELRDIALHGQIAADTNVRAYLDHLDDLARAPGLRGLATVQAAYLCDQWSRSMRQACDLQRRTVGALSPNTRSAGV